MHALASLLRGNLTVTELVLAKNDITDEGARALAAVLAGPTALRIIDLRYNHVGRSGLRALAEALERYVAWGVEGGAGVTI
jgi:Ran GTPase-activating protein (RanGAP) involved in mRNA processing and transport